MFYDAGSTKSQSISKVDLTNRKIANLIPRINPVSFVRLIKIASKKAYNLCDTQGNEKK